MSREREAREVLARAYEAANLVCPAADVRAGNKIDWVRESVALAAITAVLARAGGDAQTRIASFLAAIIDQSPNGETVEVSYLPTGEWYVRDRVAAPDADGR